MQDCMLPFSWSLYACVPSIFTLHNSPRSICLDASQETWVEYMKSRLTGKLPGKNKKVKLTKVSHVV